MPLWICLRWREPSGLASRQGTAPSGGAAPAPGGAGGPGFASSAPGAVLQGLALALLQYSPHVACLRHDSVVLEVSASLSLFGGMLSLCRQVRRSASAMGEAWHLGVAPSATGAWLLAGAPTPTRRRVLRATSLARCLDPLPLHSLPETGPHQNWLAGIGCHRLGDLRPLPRQGLQQRTQPGLVRALDAAYAQATESLAWFVPPGAFRHAHEPDFHLSRDTAILAAAQPLLQALCGWLQHRQQALHDLVLLLHHEKGRHAAPPTRVALRFSSAVWRLEDFNLLLKERLGHVTLHRVAVRLELISGPPHPRAPVSDTLFPDPARHTDEERRLLDLLAARLGTDRIQRPKPRFHHLPERANAWASGPEAPGGRKGLNGSSAPTTPAQPGGAAPPLSTGQARPFWLLPAPQRLDLRHERPVHQGRLLRLVQGPERIETGWNEGVHQRRDYFIAEDPEGARYWVYRERESGEGWFLHGLFA